MTVIEMLKKEIAQIEMTLQAQVAAKAAAIHKGDKGAFVVGCLDSSINTINQELAALRVRLHQAEESERILNAPTTQTGIEYTQELGNGETRKSRTRRFIWD